MNIFETEYQKLNTEQKEAVEAIEGPVMVLAGPGTGKTQVMAMRIANILKKTQVSPYNILCLTFTNSAVRAMRERLISIIGNEAYKIAIHTFHSFGNEIIMTHPERFLSAKSMTQISELEKIEYINQILDRGKWEKLRPIKSPYFYQKHILKAIQDLKREGVSTERYREMVFEAMRDFETHTEYFHEKGKFNGRLKEKYRKLKERIEKNVELAEIYDNYQQFLQKNGKYDFDDMIMFVLRELESDPDFLADFQERYLYILVDEYQDTNGTQNRLIEMLGGFDKSPNIFVVGDDDQSIYRFQGANLENILLFLELFPDTRKIVLQTNYRSTEEIVDATRSLIEKSHNVLNDDWILGKKIEADKDKNGEKITLAEFETDWDELNFIVSKIKELHSNDIKYGQIAVFFRNNREVNELADILAKNNIKYHLDSGQNIFEDIFIRQLIDLIKLIENPDDDQLLFRVLHFAWWQIRSINIYQLIYKYNHCKKGDVTFMSWLVENINTIDPEIAEIINLLLDKKKDVENFTIAQWLEILIRDTKINDYVLTLDDRLIIINRLKKFFNFIKAINQSDRSLDLGKLNWKLGKIIEDGIDVASASVDFEGDGINLMTAHKSKGLEFDYVFIYRCLDGVWGNQTERAMLPLIPGIVKQINEQDKEADDRRLFYVAMTRAKKRLWICWARKYGEDGKERMRSMYIGDINQELIEYSDTEQFKDRRENFMLTYIGKPSEKEYSSDEKEYFQKLLQDFRLSPTALNKYLECPRKFLYDNLIKVPKAKTATLSFGSAIHLALENFYLVYKKTGHLPEVDELKYYYQLGLSQQILTEKDYQLWLERGNQVLDNYYQLYHDDFKIPLFCEFNFGVSKLMLEDEIPVTGKVDRVEMIEDDKVLVVDYKTGKPKSRNEIMGKTKDADVGYWRQLVFYKLLGQLSSNFKYDVVMTELDFVGEDEKNKPKKEQFVIEQKEVEQLKETISTAWKSIKNNEFGCCDKQDTCTGGYMGKKCEYYDLCHKDT